MLLRLVAFGLVLQMSGAIHGVTDLLATVGIIDDHPDDGDGDGDCECPPGCPTCHCVGACALPPASRGDLIVVSTEASRTLIELEPASPREPHLLSLYRPPRV